MANTPFIGATHLSERGALVGASVAGGAQQAQRDGAAARAAQVHQEVVQLGDRHPPLELHLCSKPEGSGSSS